jgi:CRP/FNR family cyclic AMP-dependent transcriptional regulator
MEQMAQKRKKLQSSPGKVPIEVGAGTTILVFDGDSVIFGQGDAANAIFNIQKGKVKLTVVSNSGREAVIAVLGPGDFFGEGCLAAQLVLNCVN